MAIFTNSATLSYNGLITNSNTTTGEVVEVLSVTKTAALPEYSSSDSPTYVISITNSGTTPFNNLTVTDNLGSYSYTSPTTTPGGNPPTSQTLVPLTYISGSLLYLVNGVLTATPTVSAGPPLTITGISVPACGNVQLIYKASVNHFAPLNSDGYITNKASVTGGGLSVPITDTETINVRNGPNLTISKALSPLIITENGQITYTFTIQNYGNTPAVATDDVILSDTFNPPLDITSVIFNGTTWANTNYSYNSATGLFTTTLGSITVPAATYSRDAATGVWSVRPGVSILTITGII